MKTYKSDTNAVDSEISKPLILGCLKFAFAFAVLIAIFLLLPSVIDAVSRQQRQHLFCETLKPGMSLQEVLAIVDQHGNFDKGQYERDDVTTVSLGPSDIKTILKFGIRGINLVFDSEVFRSAYNNYPFGGGQPLCE